MKINGVDVSNVKLNGVQINKLTLNGVTVWEGSSGPIPAEYTELKAIHTNGDAWINSFSTPITKNGVTKTFNPFATYYDPNYFPNKRTFILKFDSVADRGNIASGFDYPANFMGAYSYGQRFGFRENNPTRLEYVNSASSFNAITSVGSASSTSTYFDNIDRSLPITIVDDSQAANNCTITINDLEPVVRSRSTNNYGKRRVNFGLFSQGGSGSTPNNVYAYNGENMSFVGDIYQIKYEDCGHESDTNAWYDGFDLRPVQRKSDGVCGLFDIVNKVFIPSNSGVDFTPVYKD